MGRIEFADLKKRAEGLALAPEGESGGLLMVSSQGDSAFAAFDLESGEFRGRVRIADGPTDAVSGTDGIELTTAALGPAFPEGVLIVQDDEEDTGGQNFKLIDLAQVRGALDAPR